MTIFEWVYLLVAGGAFMGFAETKEQGQVTFWYALVLSILWPMRVGYMLTNEKWRKK